jgi:predicted nucleic acid-binding Zn ribbon protein
MTAEPVTTCPLCLGHVKRLISGGSGPLFKGTGFYHTDYKMVNKKSETKQEAKSEKKADTK